MNEKLRGNNQGGETTDDFSIHIMGLIEDATQGWPKLREHNPELAAYFDQEDADWIRSLEADEDLAV